MEVRYKRDLNSNYMILENKGAGEQNHEVRMLTENRIYGFLPCVYQEQTDKREYYYEITGCQSMTLSYERRKLTCQQLRELLRDLEKILEAAGEYLLSPDHFLLNPEYIYLGTNPEKLYLCYFPGYEKPIRESFLDLAEYLLGKVDKSDAEGIEFGYDLYQCALEPNFSLLEILRRHTFKEEPEEAAADSEPLPEPPVSVRSETLEKTGSWKNFFRKRGRKPQLEDYVAEAAQLNSGSVLFLKEGEPAKETTYLQQFHREGLFLKSKNDEYPDIHIKEDNALIGKRKESVDVCIPAPTVSRIHARITHEASGYYVEDLNSTNGTWVDQVQLNPYEPHQLESGMRITFASTEYEVRGI